MRGGKARARPGSLKARGDLRSVTLLRRARVGHRPGPGVVWQDALLPARHRIRPPARQRFLRDALRPHRPTPSDRPVHKPTQRLDSSVDYTRTVQGGADAAAAGHAGPVAAAPRALPIGTMLEGFRIVGVIGEGGFGVVYRAWDDALERHVAIKEYMPESLVQRGPGALALRAEHHRSAFEAGCKSFLAEARMLARFDHPALVKVLHFWEANGTAYMAMPCYEGPTLKAALAAMREPPSEAMLRGWLAPLLDALAVLHAEHYTHRDIAPDNILLTAKGPLLLDFGAARRVIGDMGKHDVTVVLKKGYAPIEQYGADSFQGPWTDLYALAGVVHYAITRQVPPASVERVVLDRRVPLGDSHPERYSAAFLHAIDTTLAVRPEKRPQSVAELRALLERKSAPAGEPPVLRDTVAGAPAGAPAPAAVAAALDPAPVAAPAQAPTPVAVPGVVLAAAPAPAPPQAAPAPPAVQSPLLASASADGAWAPVEPRLHAAAPVTAAVAGDPMQWRASPAADGGHARYERFRRRARTAGAGRWLGLAAVLALGVVIGAVLWAPSGEPTAPAVAERAAPPPPAAGSPAPANAAPPVAGTASAPNAAGEGAAAPSATESTRPVASVRAAGARRVPQQPAVTLSDADPVVGGTPLFADTWRNLPPESRARLLEGRSTLCEGLLNKAVNEGLNAGEVAMLTVDCR